MKTAILLLALYSQAPAPPPISLQFHPFASEAEYDLFWNQTKGTVGIRYFDLNVRRHNISRDPVDNLSQ